MENNKNRTMKKIFYIIIIMAVFLTSCYEDFRNDYPYTTVAFSTATGGLTTAGELGRTVCKDEGLKLDIGVYLAGVLENKKERQVTFTIDPTLLAGTSYELMPSNYYHLSNNSTFVIPSGSFVGKVTVTLDSTLFLNDPKAVQYHYALPIRLTGTTADSILSTQSTKIVVVKYINRMTGYYYNTGTYTTYNQSNAEINKGSFSTVVEGTTISADSVETDGILMMLDEGYLMRLKIKSDNTVTWRKLPNPPLDLTPKNIAPAPTKLVTDYCSGWETLEAVRDGYEPASSTDRSHGVFGNWDSYNDWGYLEYDFARYYKVDKSEIYWFTDFGGLLMPDEVNIQYYDYSTGTWKEVTNPSAYGKLPDQWNVTTFDPVVTNKVRINFLCHTGSIGVTEWKVWGIPSQVLPEQAPMATVVPNGANTWDPSTSTFTLNYKVTYDGETYYTTASSKLVWRNRMRDGVNEWRR